MIQVERLTRVVTFALVGNRLQTTDTDGFFKAGEYTRREILDFISHAQTQGWVLVSATTRKSEDTGQQFLDMFFRHNFTPSPHV